MFTQNDICLPLALTVIIDNKVKDPELNEFVKQVNALMPLFDLPPMTQNEALMWFKQHESEIKKNLKSKGKNTIVLKALTRFKEDVHVENLYEAMLSISISDNEYIKEESELIKSAATIWGFQRPPFKVSR